MKIFTCGSFSHKQRLMSSTKSTSQFWSRSRLWSISTLLSVAQQIRINIQYPRHGAAPVHKMKELTHSFKSPTKCMEDDHDRDSQDVLSDASSNRYNDDCGIDDRLKLCGSETNIPNASTVAAKSLKTEINVENAPKSEVSVEEKAEDCSDTQKDDDSNIDNTANCKDYSLRSVETQENLFDDKNGKKKLGRKSSPSTEGIKPDCKSPDKKKNFKKRASRLSLNTIKSPEGKSKFKEFLNQPNLTTFFDVVAPKPVLENEDTAVKTTKNDGGLNEASVVSPEVKEKKAKSMKTNESVDGPAEKVKRKKATPKKKDPVNNCDGNPGVKVKRRGRPKKSAAVEKKDEEKLAEERQQSYEKDSKNKDQKRVRFSSEVKEFSPEPTPKKNSRKLADEASEEIEIATSHTKEEGDVLKDVSNSVSITEKPYTAIKKSDSQPEERSDSSSKKQASVIDLDDSIDTSQQHETNENLPVKNAFKFMMDCRHKVIGRNSPGKEIEIGEDNTEIRKENKKKLTTRKGVFQEWAESKGATKRQLEDEEKEVCISKKLRKRAKRMKKMLTQTPDEQNDLEDDSQDKIIGKKRKVVAIIHSDSESSQEPLHLTGCDPLPSANAGPEVKHISKRKRTTIKKPGSDKKPLSPPEIHVIESDNTVEEDVQVVKKSKLLDCSESSNSDSVIVCEDNEPVTPKNSTFYQTDLSNFFRIKNPKDIESSSEEPVTKTSLNGSPSGGANSKDKSTTKTKISTRKAKKNRKSLTLKKSGHDSQPEADNNENTEAVTLKNDTKGASKSNASKEAGKDGKTIKFKIKLKQKKKTNDRKLGKTRNKPEKIPEVGGNNKIADECAEICEVEETFEPESNNSEGKNLPKAESTENEEPCSALQDREGDNPRSKKKKELKIDAVDVPECSSNVTSTKKKKKTRPESATAPSSSALTPRSPWKMRVRLNLVPENDGPDSEIMNPLDKIRKNGQKVIAINSVSEDEIVSSDTDDESYDESVISSEDDTFVDKKRGRSKGGKPSRDSAKTPVKLAPIFVKSAPKPKLDPAVAEARRQFLHGSHPDSLRKRIEKQQRVETSEYEIFPSISHIKAKPPENEPGLVNYWNLPEVTLKTIDAKSFIPSYDVLQFKTLTTLTKTADEETESLRVEKIANFKTYVDEIKTQHPHYPVHKAFRLLNAKSAVSEDVKSENEPQKREPAAETVETNPRKASRKKRSKKKRPSVEIVEVDQPQGADQKSLQDVWTEKYKPATSEEIFGNNSGVTELKNWLTTWLQFSEEINALRSKRKRNDSDGSSSDFDTTDGDSRDSARLPGNTFILSGPCGSGKTTAVYALCNELSINVIEVNASSKRTGKRLLQELHEATQSHQVQKKEANVLAGFLHKDAQNSSCQSMNSQNNQKTKSKMCLLLVEDIDIVYDQDEGFVSAVSQLISTSKRPVILTTTDNNSSHVQKFTCQYPVINFSSLSERVIVPWLQIVCLLEGLCVECRSLVELLKWNKGDVRSTLLQLQFWAQTGGHAVEKYREGYPRQENTPKSSEDFAIEDEISDASKNGNENEPADNIFHVGCIRNRLVFDGRNKLSLPLSPNLGFVWWNLPNVLALRAIKHTEPSTDGSNETGVVLKSSDEISEDETVQVKKDINLAELSKLQAFFNVADSLALSDCVYKKLDIGVDVEPAARSWDRSLKNSLELGEDMRDYSEGAELAQEWTHTLVEGYLNNCGDLRLEDGSIDLTVPSVEALRWRTKQHECDNSFLDAIPLSCHGDRHSISSNYLPVLRTMARTEVVRASVNTKRKNRFYNYLRGLGVNGSDNNFNMACGVFCPNHN